MKLDESDLVLIQGDSPYIVYIIECFTIYHYYIGKTTDFSRRISQHIEGKGSLFTKQHGVHDVVGYFKCKSEYQANKLEEELTKVLVYVYGSENICGGSFSQIKPSNKKKMFRIINGENLIHMKVVAYFENKECYKLYRCFSIEKLKEEINQVINTIKEERITLDDGRIIYLSQCSFKVNSEPFHYL